MDAIEKPDHLWVEISEDSFKDAICSKPVEVENSIVHLHVCEAGAHAFVHVQREFFNVELLAQPLLKTLSIVQSFRNSYENAHH
jgi:hypothetical protein